MARVRRTTPGVAVGKHLIAEFSQCRGCDLSDEKRIRSLLLEAALQCGATVLHEKFHRFSPQGITGYLLLAESHISIHTWPEYDYAAVDIFTCGKMRSRQALRSVREGLGAGSCRIVVVERGTKSAQRITPSR